ncbi:MAG: KOW domain-containing RNA-binding protein [Oscillospiraceae bacterium]|nr:KOW domain-containing RNA-binding protein [Oscillospiraceae bacterium]
MENAVGRIVRSAAGRDKGKFLVVVAADDEFVMVADGKERRLGNLKRKRLKHVKFTNTVIDMTNITDKKLRSITGEWNLRACDPRN